MTVAPQTVVLLCGGKGLRMRADGGGPPKSLVRIGGRPIIWHVMKIYSQFGYRDFVLTLGHRGEEIVEYFERYLRSSCDSTMTFDPPDRVTHSQLPDDERAWSLTFLQTGEDTQTGGRIKRAVDHIRGDHFLATYTDGVADVNIAQLVRQHLSSGLPATMLSVFTPIRFGIVEAQNGIVTRFEEKPTRSVRINGGFFAFHKSILDRIGGDDDRLEMDVLMPLAAEGRLGCLEHDGFWHCVDTPKDLLELQRRWDSGHALWKSW